MIKLGKEFERIGAEAQHLPLATPLDGVEKGERSRMRRKRNMKTSPLGPW